MMADRMNLNVAVARKRVALSCLALGTISIVLSILPAMLARHGFPVVWIVVPLALLAAACMAYTVIELQAFLKAKAAHGE